MKVKLALATFAVVGLLAGSAWAQDAPAGNSGGNGVTTAVSGTGANRTQEFNFTDELVQGQLVRPDGETTRVRRRGQGISLIRIREHFVPEMLKSVENL